MKRTVLLLASMTAALVLSSGLALAVTRQCETDIECFGTRRSDTLLGTDGHNGMYGKGAGDTLKGFDGGDGLHGQGGSDKLFGGASGDDLTGGPGNDVLAGGEDRDRYIFEANGWGDDTIFDAANPLGVATTNTNVLFQCTVSADLIVDLNSGKGPEIKNSAGTSTVNWSGNVIYNPWVCSSGDDRIVGNAGPNWIISKTGADRVKGGAGDDEIWVDDNVGDDIVDCGEGNDHVSFDTGDTVTNCEER